MDRPVRTDSEQRRLINRRQQGDLGEASAIEWLTSVGATVLIPFGHSPHYDLVADIDGRLVRIQVKTSTQKSEARDGRSRSSVSLITSGGNQSWGGFVKQIDPVQVDFIFVLTGDGRRWLIPTDAIEGRVAITVGGARYSEFEIEPGRAIRDLVYWDAALESESRPGEYPSGQRGGAVNAMAQPSQVRILPPPSARPATKPEPYVPRVERALGKTGQAVVRQKRQMTIPQKPFMEAGLNICDRIRFRAEGDGRIVMERIEAVAAPFDSAL